MNINTRWGIHRFTIGSADEPPLFLGMVGSSREQIADMVYAEFGPGSYFLVEQTLSSTFPVELSRWVLEAALGGPLKIVPLDEWLALVNKKPGDENSESSPVTKVKSGFKKGPPFDQQNERAMKEFEDHLRGLGISPASFRGKSDKDRAAIWKGFASVLKGKKPPNSFTKPFHVIKRAINRRLKATKP